MERLEFKESLEVARLIAARIPEFDDSEAIEGQCSPFSSSKRFEIEFENLTITGSLRKSGIYRLHKSNYFNEGSCDILSTQEIEDLEVFNDDGKIELADVGRFISEIEKAL